MSILQNSLAFLAEKYNTDKKVDAHNYVSFYEKYFEPIRYDVTSVLEIGIGRAKAASLRMWAEYFPNATIIGMDIDDHTQYSGDRIKILQLNQVDEFVLKYHANQLGPFDIIIEDGSHIQHHQQLNLAWLLPYVKPNGYLVLEDLYYAYDAEALSKCIDLSQTNTLDVVKRYINTGKIVSDFLTPVQAKYVEESVKFCKIENGKYIDYVGGQDLSTCQHAECAVFQKK